jgi:hypothetical protein
VASTQRFWRSRARWRLRGAWQWPAFGALTVIDGFILHLLPPTRTGVDLVPALIVSSFGNLFLVGLVAPWIVRRLVARESAGPRAVPREVVLDRTATALLAAGTLGLVAAGLATRPLVVSETEATEENARLVRAEVLARGSEEERRNLETANTVRLDEGFFRTCIAADDRRRAFCYFVNTGADPPTVRRDPSRVPNSEFVRR